MIKWDELGKQRWLVRSSFNKGIMEETKLSCSTFLSYHEAHKRSRAVWIGDFFSNICITKSMV